MTQKYNPYSSDFRKHHNQQAGIHFFFSKIILGGSESTNVSVESKPSKHPGGSSHPSLDLRPVAGSAAQALPATGQVLGAESLAGEVAGRSLGIVANWLLVGQEICGKLAGCRSNTILLVGCFVRFLPQVSQTANLSDSRSWLSQKW